MNKYFRQALPIWKKAAQDEVNLHMRFRADVIGMGEAVVKLAASDAYQLFVNGCFVSAGPARCAKGFFRVDEIDISHLLNNEKNHIAIIVCSYNVASYQYAKNNGFLACEIIKDNVVVAATGVSGFISGVCDDYIRETNRYSFQRQFCEVMSLKENSDVWKNGGRIEECETQIISDVNYLDRNVLYPQYETLHAEAISGGDVSLCDKKSKKELWYLNFEEAEYFIFKEPKENLFEQIAKIKTDNVNFEKNSVISNEKFVLYRFRYNATGFLSAKIKSFGNSTVYIIFDEILTKSSVDGTRLDCTNAVKYYLSEGEHNILTAEPYTMRYVCVCVFGEVLVSDLKMIEYKHPPINKKINCKDEKIQKIYDAAVETFRQNALDIFMDCPSRERAGWLCDSYFTARAENFLCGKNKVEENFLENFLLPDSFENIPDGMFPMCYPAFHTDGKYIPNWAMWLVVELWDYYERTGKKDLIEKFRGKIYKLIEFFKRFENDEGLLENLDSWVFVDWSAANDYTDGINYPTNMMYAYMNECAGKLYSDDNLIKKSENLRKLIRERSYNGEYFVDNFVKDIDCKEHISEACQYYAFFTKTADRQMYPKLWEKILNELGPERDIQIGKANAFVGNYLRLILFEREGMWRQILDEIVDYFYYMAEKTGTLWEKIDSKESLNHGFASYAAVLIHKAVTYSEC